MVISNSLFYTPSKVDEFQIPKNSEANQYIPLDLKYLKPEKATSFPIYVYHPARERFVLFKSANCAIKESQLAMLSRGGRKPVFVPKESSYELNQYLSEDLHNIVVDPQIPLQEKTEKFHNIANTVLKGLFEDPPNMKEFVRTAKNISDSVSKLILEDPASILQLSRLRSYDYYTYSHSMNVTVLSVGLYLDLMPSTTEEKMLDLSRGVLLHDVGKCDIPTNLTNKQGPLSEEEWEIMRSHTVKGYERLENDSSLSEDSRLIALYHHEALDGSGYPEQKRKDQIPFTSRICKVVDVYDALTSRRSYKDGMTPYEAISLMIHEMKDKVDHDILKAFVLFLRKMGKMSM